MPTSFDGKIIVTVVTFLFVLLSGVFQYQLISTAQEAQQRDLIHQENNDLRIDTLRHEINAFAAEAIAESRRREALLDERIEILEVQVGHNDISLNRVIDVILSPSIREDYMHERPLEPLRAPISPNQGVDQGVQPKTAPTTP